MLPQAKIAYRISYVNHATNAVGSFSAERKISQVRYINGTAMDNDRTSFIRTVSFCAGLPDSAIAELSAIAIPLQRPAGAFIQFEGDPADAMYLVIDGRVKIARTSASGREQVLNVIGAGGHFNTVPMFDGGLCPANAQAIDNVALLALPRDQLQRVVEN